MGTDSKYRHTDDAEIVARFRHANPAEQQLLFAAVYDRHLFVVLSYCASQLNERDSSSDAAHDAFAAAFESLRNGAHPDRLLPWLIGIARYRCLEYRRGTDPGVRRRGSLDPLSLDGQVDAQDARSADEIENLSRRRRAQVDRLLDTVASTLTAKQQELFALSIRQGLAGERLGQRIGKTAAQASRDAYDLAVRLEEGFGALVLSREGRPYCANLASILDMAATRGGSEFTAALRERIVRHFGTCKICDACGTCIEQRRRLVAPLVPVLIPILVLSQTRERIKETIERVSFTKRLPPPPPPPGWQSEAPRSEPRRRRLALGSVLAVLLVILGAVLIPRLFVASGTSIGPAAAGPATSIPAELAGSFGNWQIPQWTLAAGDGSPSRGASEWALTGPCSTPDTCAYNLTVIRSDQGPDLFFTDDLAETSPFEGQPRRVLQFAPVQDGTLRAAATYPFDCGNDIDAQRVDYTDTVTLDITGTTTVNDQQVATAMTITWKTDSAPSPEAVAFGCTPTTLTYSAQATRST